MRQYLAIQAMESGKPLARGLAGRSPMIPYGNAGMLMNGEANNPSKVGACMMKLHLPPFH